MKPDNFLSFLLGAGITASAGVVTAWLISTFGEQVDSLGEANVIAVAFVLFAAGLTVALVAARKQIAVDVALFGVGVGGCAAGFLAWLFHGLLHT